MSISIVENRDCLEAMKEFPDKFFDLAIVDPPYGIGESGAKNHSRGKLAKAKDYKAFAGNDLCPPDKEYFDELMRVSKNQIIWGANHFISKIPYDSHCWIVWDKENGDNDFADCELAWTSFDTAVRQFRFRWAGMLQGDMANKEFRIHPTQKPVALYQWILSEYAKHRSAEHLRRLSESNTGKKKSLEQKMKAWVPIVQLDKDGNIIKHYGSATQAFEETGIDKRQINNCCKGRQKTAHGFVWKYDTDL